MSLCYIANIQYTSYNAYVAFHKFYKKKNTNHTNFIYRYEVILVNNLNNSCLIRRKK